MPLAVWLLTASSGSSRANSRRRRWSTARRLRLGLVLPLAAPGLATTAILTFVYCWNEFLFALAFTLGPSGRPCRSPSRFPWRTRCRGARFSLPLLLLRFRSPCWCCSSRGGSSGADSGASKADGEASLEHDGREDSIRRARGRSHSSWGYRRRRVARARGTLGAAGRARRSGSLRGWRTGHPGRPVGGGDVTCCRRRSAMSRWSFRATRSIPTRACAKTSRTP